MQVEDQLTHFIVIRYSQSWKRIHGSVDELTWEIQVGIKGYVRLEASEILLDNSLFHKSDHVIGCL